MSALSDEELAAALLRPLADPPLGPPRVDVRRAMAQGRRHRRRRTLAISGSALATAAVVVVSAVVVANGRSAHTGRPAAPRPPVTRPQGASCTVQKLAVPDGYELYVRGIDPSGRYILGSTSRRTSDPNRPEVNETIWDNGKPSTVDRDVSGRDVDLYDATTGGVAVGTVLRTKDPQQDRSASSTPAVVRDGKLTHLPTTTGDNSAYAINEAGVIVGAHDATGEGYPVPVKWASAGATPVALPMPAGAPHGEAFDIDEDGTIVGEVYSDFHHQRPYVWFPDGTGRELSVPADAKDKWDMRPKIRNGWVTANGVVWNLRTGATRQIPGADVIGITSTGRMLTGGALLESTATSTAGPKIDLPALPGAADQVEVHAQYISADGTVVVGMVAYGRRVNPPSDGPSPPAAAPSPPGSSMDITYQPAIWRCTG
ncbi:hypothetical protein HC031_12945 [Planosporangium thailandense]|uniref:Uncharacterized protein n=1 Tax=Planosporangium thailandense TaxID=765197 RepID=A0ABX0XZE4_9ACTN|nr:hypothetical protein [Planosporangium thailandense]NJC70614.1 hypothetical protein [Planosporangium thailandense]